MDTQSIITLLALLLLVIVVSIRVFFWPGMRRRRILAREFPDSWLAILRKRLKYFERLPDELQLQLQNLIKLFLADKQFIGCAGQQIDDDIRITIAAQACLLILNRGHEVYPELHAVLVYPSTFVTERESIDEAGVVSIDHATLLGESWAEGKVILAWDNVENGVLDLEDGYNVVLHEFAHQLDHQTGATNGAPLLFERGDYRRWARVLSREYAELQRHADSGERSLLDHYGASNPAEFFAVATETFFERPREMAWHHRDLYLELVNFYRVDPLTWLPAR